MYYHLCSPSAHHIFRVGIRSRGTQGHYVKGDSYEGEILLVRLSIVRQLMYCYQIFVADLVILLFILTFCTAATMCKESFLMHCNYVAGLGGIAFVEQTVSIRVLQS